MKDPQRDDEMSGQTEQEHYVYTLAYPDGGVFYVGKGSGDRISSHEEEALLGNGDNPHKERVIRSIWRAGGQVKKDIVAYFPSEEEALAYEVFLIKNVYGRENLTNLTMGGKGHATSEVLVDGKAMKKLRIEALLTVMQLAVKSGVSIASINRMEAGRYTLRRDVVMRVLDALSQVLGRTLTVKDVERH